MPKQTASQKLSCSQEKIQSLCRSSTEQRRMSMVGQTVKQVGIKPNDNSMLSFSGTIQREREFIFHIAKTLNKYTTEMQN